MYFPLLHVIAPFLTCLYYDDVANYLNSKYIDIIVSFRFLKRNLEAAYSSHSQDIKVVILNSKSKCRTFNTDMKN